jgi:predicted MPP superfamily phosphohydrolase
MIADEKKKVNEKRKEKLEDVYFGDLEEATTRAHKEQYGVGLKHHPDTSRNTLINFIFKKGLNVEKHLKDIEREDKERKEKRQKEYEAGVAKMEKQAKRGTLPWKQFYEYLQDDKEFNDEYDERINDIREGYSWGGDFYRIVKKITKRDIDVWSDLTDAQQEKYYDIVAREVERDHGSYLKEIYEEVIKKKKFNSLKEAVDTFMKKYISG